MDNITNDLNPALDIINTAGINGDLLPRREDTRYGITFTWIRTDFHCSTSGKVLPEQANFPFANHDLQNDHCAYAREQIKGIAGEIALNTNANIDWFDNETKEMVFAEFIKRHDCLMTCDLLDGMKKGYGTFARSMEK